MTTSSSCLFCRIIKGEIPSEIVYSDDQVVAFRDIHPEAPVHILIVPRLHLPSIADFDKTHMTLLAGTIEVANQLAKLEGIDQSGYRLATNAGPNAGQEVLHLHWHLLGGKPLGALTR